MGTPEIVLCLVVALLVLGPDQLPRAARQVGEAIAELKKMAGSVQQQVNEMVTIENDDDTPARHARTPSGAHSVATEPAPIHPDTEGFRLIDDRITRADEDDEEDDDHSRPGVERE